MLNTLKRNISLATILLLIPGVVFAADAIDTGDTAWLIVSSALVLLMLPGLALFYGGMVRSKNVLSTSMHTFAAMAIIGVQWVVVGYTIAFGGEGKFFGSFANVMHYECRDSRNRLTIRFAEECVKDREGARNAKR